jgi:hypothetical protein
MSATTESAWIHALIAASYPGRHATKRVARDAAVPVGTARGWLSGRFVPSTAYLLRLARENEQLRADLIRKLESHIDEVMGQGVLPLDGEALPPTREGSDGARRVVEGVARLGRVKR